METELRQFIEQAQFCRAAVQRVAELLPPDVHAKRFPMEIGLPDA
jgi:hypothetical protein